MINLVNTGNIIEVVDCMFKWEHTVPIVLLKVGPHKWVGERVVRWLKICSYKCVMGSDIMGPPPTSCHKQVSSVVQGLAQQNICRHTSGY